MSLFDRKLDTPIVFFQIRVGRCVLVVLASMGWRHCAPMAGACVPYPDARRDPMDSDVNL